MFVVQKHRGSWRSSTETECLICGMQYLFLLSIIQQTTGLRKSHPWTAYKTMRCAVSKPPTKPVTDTVYENFFESANTDIQIMDPVEECYQNPNLKDVMFEPPIRLWSPKPKENGTTLSLSSDSGSRDNECSSSSESETGQDRSMDFIIKVVEHLVLQDRKRKVTMDKLNNSKRSHIKSSLFSSDSDGESSKEVIKTHRTNKQTGRQTQKQKPGERMTQ